MATLTGVPVEEYLRTSYEPETEYVDGQLVERHLGDYHHSYLHTLIGAELLERSRERRFRVFGNQTIRIDETRYRVPDICVKALPYRVTPILSQPDLVIEIVSPDDTPKGHLERIRDYQGGGNPFYLGSRSLPADACGCKLRHDSQRSQPGSGDPARRPARFRRIVRPALRANRLGSC